MGRTHLVVDGSNIATEGRTAPSLEQLDQAVREFVVERPYEQVVVIVDATFGHRIDSSEVARFEEAVLASEMVTPPAGTIGRGDAFILEVARRADADVLSNDSFQELHADHPWLFEGGRLWGGKPVPAVGWVFVARAPVRGVTSRKVVQAAKKAAKKEAVPKADAKPASSARAAGDGKSGDAKAGRDRKGAGDAKAAGGRPAKATRASARSGTGSSAEPDRRSGRARVPTPINEQLPYATFVVHHPVGSTVDGTVDRFSSHGAYVRLGDALGYVALKSLGDPPPRSARQVLTIGEQRPFNVLRFDPTTRGIDLAPAGGGATTTSAPRTRGEAATAAAVSGSNTPDAEEAPVSPVAKRPAKKKAAAKKATARKATAKKSTAKKTTAKKATAKRAVKRAPAKKKAAAKRAPARKKAAAKKAPARKKAAAKKAPARKKTAAKRAPARKKAPARKATAKKR